MFPLESVSVNVTVLGVTAAANVTVGSVETGLLEEPATGVTLVTAVAPRRLRRIEDHVNAVACTRVRLSREARAADVEDAVTTARLM